jgi:hypothetical protein
MDDRIIAFISVGNHIVKEIHVHIPANTNYFEQKIKYDVEDQNF